MIGQGPLVKDHKHFICERCNRLARTKNRHKIPQFGGKVENICFRCYQSSTAVGNILKADKQTYKEWKIKHMKEPITKPEVGVLITKYEKEGLSESAGKERLKGLKYKIRESHQKIAQVYKKEKPTSQEMFEELVRKKNG